MGKLVLSRKVSEKIMIGSDIALTVVDIRRGKVRLGIDAPRGVEVHREEVFQAIERRKVSDDETSKGRPKKKDIRRRSEV